MTENPYYRLLTLIRAQQPGAGARFFIARLQQLSPPVFTADGASVSPDLIPAGFALQENDLGADFLCLWLEGQVLPLFRLEHPSWR